VSLDYAATVMPAADFEAAGDMFLVAPRADGTIMFVVGDAAGHGPDAAARADVVRPVLARAARSHAGPDEALETANAELLELDDDRGELYTTAVAVLAEPASRSLSWAYAGHLPPHWISTGAALDGARPGVPLAVLPVVGCTTASRHDLKPGEGVVLYTDGLEDARGPGRARFGVARVTHALAGMAEGASAEGVVSTLASEVRKWTGGVLSDDVCILAVRFP
jgi:phosphoserine phosphatase RsbU/P